MSQPSSNLLAIVMFIILLWLGFLTVDMNKISYTVKAKTVEGSCK